MDKLREFMAYTYKKISLPMPKIVICDDPLSAVKLGRKLGLKSLQTFHYFGLGYDMGWFSFYDYFHRIGAIKSKLFLKYQELFLCGAFGYIFLDKIVIAIRRPLYIHRDAQKHMHCETGPAVEFLGGKFKSYRWHGLCVPEKFIMRPQDITRED